MVAVWPPAGVASCCGSAASAINPNSNDMTTPPIVIQPRRDIRPASPSCSTSGAVTASPIFVSPEGFGGSPSASNSNRAASRLLDTVRSEEHTSELQSLMRRSYDVFCVKNKTKTTCSTLFRAYTTQNKYHTA